MYQPVLSRFQSLDPVSPNGVDLLDDHNWFGNRLTRMKNLYGYADNNPVTYTDPSGLSFKKEESTDDPNSTTWQRNKRKCIVTVYCGPTPLHCAFSISDGTSSWHYHAGPTIGLPPVLDYEVGYDPAGGKVWGWGSYTISSTTYPPSVCDCLRNYVRAWKKLPAKPSYDPFSFFGCNSNWALNCSLTKCKVNVSWWIQPPGLKCLVCTKWAPASSGVSDTPEVCCEYKETPCP